MQRLLSSLIGDREKLPLHQRILNLAGLSGFLAFLQASLFDSLFHHNYYVGFVSAVLALLFLVIYYLTRRLGYHAWPMYAALSLSLFVAVPLLWWQNNGIFGSIPYWIVFLGGVISVLLEGWKRLLFLFLAVAVLVVLTSLDYLHITDSKPFYNHFNLLVDLVTQIIVVLILSSVLISVLVLEYTYEQRRVQELANIDYVSGLYTRRYILDQCDREIKKCMRYRTPFSLLICDVDDFKQINDNYGHDAGDFTIQHIAQIFWNHIRATDVAARWGGEEFLILFPETDMQTARQIAERLHHAVQEEPCMYKGKDISFTISFGISSYKDPLGQTPIEQCIKVADGALYESKKGGKNRITVGHCPTPDSQTTEDPSGAVLLDT